MPLRQQLLRGAHRQRQVDVVAAEQDVLADREPLERKLPLVLANADQREVAGAAADIDNQDHVARLDLRAPRVARALDPGVERGLRLLEQRHVREPRLRRGLYGQLARLRNRTTPAR